MSICYSDETVLRFVLQPVPALAMTCVGDDWTDYLSHTLIWIYIGTNPERRNNRGSIPLSRLATDVTQRNGNGLSELLHRNIASQHSGDERCSANGE